MVAAVLIFPVDTYTKMLEKYKESTPILSFAYNFFYILGTNNGKYIEKPSLGRDSSSTLISNDI